MTNVAELPIVDVELNRLFVKPASLMRVTTDAETIHKYTTVLGELPPILVVAGPDDAHWIADGRHRYEAFKLAGRKTIPCRVVAGTHEDAFRLACRANDRHGLVATDGDKRHRVEKAIRAFPGLSNVLIAEMCNVSEFLVRQLAQDDRSGERMQSTSIPIEVAPTVQPHRLGKDGKYRPATRKGSAKKAPEKKDAKPSSASNGASRERVTTGPRETKAPTAVAAPTHLSSDVSTTSITPMTQSSHVNGVAPSGRASLFDQIEAFAENLIRNTAERPGKEEVEAFCDRLKVSLCRCAVSWNS